MQIKFDITHLTKNELEKYRQTREELRAQRDAAIEKIELDYQLARRQSRDAALLASGKNPADYLERFTNFRHDSDGFAEANQ